MALKPAALTALMSCWLVAGLPHAVSPQMASSVLPRFQPTVIWLATCGRRRKSLRECGGAKMDASSNAPSATTVRHFAAEGLRSDMRFPLV